MTEEGGTRKIGPLRIPQRVQRVSWGDLAASLGPVLIVSVVAIWIAVHFVRPAPPDTIIITSGPEGSIGQTTAEKYRKILVRNGVTLEILPSEGSLENLQRLADPQFKVDVGFVQGGLSELVDTTGLVSLGSVFYQAVLIFYRAPAPIGRLSQLKGRRVAIGPEGSGTRFLALALLKANGIEPKGPTRLRDLGGQVAAQALLTREIDAAFLTGDSASPATMRELLRTREIRLFNFTQRDAYVRHFRYLIPLDLPAGVLDLGSNLPPKTLVLLAPTVELIARAHLHPALSDLLIEAARDVHGRATLIQRAGEFPAPLEHEYRISADAARYYKSGKSFAYRHLPFWLASLVDRAAVVLVPIIIVLIPGLRLVPTIYGWRIKTRIYRHYGELMSLERAALSQPGPQERAELLGRLDKIERTVITVKMPGSVADQLYVLRQHITWVRERLAADVTGSP
ncbi:MAG: C4-dicarboxylate ABC transporter substrate-binding protein [Candidatus Rokuibacteriota bacterium]|nr:MAG: C4-dicarboxylate ABC transporter substrate-binding protein [Candidatus Rokubacteria bacterium]